MLLYINFCQLLNNILSAYIEFTISKGFAEWTNPLLRFSFTLFWCAFFKPFLSLLDGILEAIPTREEFHLIESHCRA